MEFQDACARLASELVTNGVLSSWEPLHGGVSAHVVLLRVGRADRSGWQQEFVLRMPGEAAFKEQGADGARREFDLLRVLHAAGLAVPQPLRFTADTLERPSYVMEHVDGSTALSTAEIEDAMDQMAAFLARLHTLDTSQLDGIGLPQLEDPAEGALDYLADDATGQRARAAIRSANVASTPSPRRLVHGDYWPGNVLWRDGRLAAVIDWEDASLGDPLADLAAARVELLCQHGDVAMQHFTERYLDRATPIDPQRLLLWEIYVSCSALATMAQWGLEPEDESRRRAATSAFLERAAGELADSCDRPANEYH